MRKLFFAAAAAVSAIAITSTSFAAGPNIHFGGGPVGHPNMHTPHWGTQPVHVPDHHPVHVPDHHPNWHVDLHPIFVDGYSQPEYVQPSYAQPSYVQQAEYVAPVQTADVPNPAPPASIQLVNPETNKVALSYRLDDGAVQSLPAGTSVQISQLCVISFDRGANAGRARYSMTDGTYTFQPSSGAWELFKSPAADSSQSLASEDSNPPPR